VAALASSQTIPATPEALPTSFSSLSIAPPRKPKTFNDIPDELLDDIAHWLPKGSHRQLALVERRLYAPARRGTAWYPYGSRLVREFSRLLLERPRFASLVRRLTLGGASVKNEASSLGRTLLPSDVE